MFHVFHQSTILSHLARLQSSANHPTHKLPIHAPLNTQHIFHPRPLIMHTDRMRCVLQRVINAILFLEVITQTAFHVNVPNHRQPRRDPQHAARERGQERAKEQGNVAYGRANCLRAPFNSAFRGAEKHPDSAFGRTPS